MTYAEWQRFVTKQLGELYSESEAKTIARRVLQDVLQVNAGTVLLEMQKEMEPSVQACLDDIVKRLLEYEPVQYITGVADFYGMKFKVNPHVLIPRPETEELVQWILTDLTNTEKPKTPAILDVGTGSGCIAIALKKHVPSADVFAMDISEEVLTVARQNAAMNNVQVNFFKGDILTTPYSDKQYDIIVSNPPYIRKSEQRQMQPNVVNYEPHLALFVDDTDARVFYRAICRFATTALTSNGLIYFEINESLGAEVKHLLAGLSFKNIVICRDLSGKERMVRCSAH